MAHALDTSQPTSSSIRCRRAAASTGGWSTTQRSRRRCIAREVERPVQLIYSRQQEMLRGWPRTPVAALLARQDRRAAAVSRRWRTRIAVPSTNREFGRPAVRPRDPLEARRGGEGDARSAGARRRDAALRHSACRARPGRRCGSACRPARLRGNAHGYTAFFTESFIDELAHAARREPLSYRIEMLGGDLRLAACLQRGRAAGGVGRRHRRERAGARLPPHGRPAGAQKAAGGSP